MHYLPDRVDGPRLSLRLTVPDDAAALYRHVSSDAEVTKYVEWEPHSDEAMTRRVIIDAFNVGAHNRTWAITLRDSDELVGIFECQRWPKHSIEIASLVGKQWWGQGLGTEAGHMVLRILRAEPSLYRMWATCSVENTSCARSLQLGGMRLEGTIARHVVYPNLGLEPRDSLLFGMALR